MVIKGVINKFGFLHIPDIKQNDPDYIPSEVNTRNIDACHVAWVIKASDVKSKKKHYRTVVIMSNGIRYDAGEFLNEKDALKFKEEIQKYVSEHR